jgi:AraC family L-rhamnose operon regulatory protein RhaS
MVFYTIGCNHFSGFQLPIYQTIELDVLDHNEMKDVYKIIFIKSGTIYLSINEKEYILSGACLLCINEKDKLKIHKTEDVNANIILFKPEVINRSFNFVSVNNDEFSGSEIQDMFCINSFKHSAGISVKLYQLREMDSLFLSYKIQMLKEQLERQSSRWPCRSRSNLLEILFFIARREPEEDEQYDMEFCAGLSKLSHDIIYYLQTAYDKKITIEMLADEFHTNRTTLLTDFKKCTGKSIHNYLIQLRLSMASALLRDTSLSIDEISNRTGFYDISYFSKAFKRMIKCTPTEYRKKNNQNEW